MIFGDLDILARTVYGESRGESYKGKKAVAHVMLNRWRSTKGQFARDDTIATACLRHRQFSAWDAGDPNFTAMQEVDLSDVDFRTCMRAALEAVDEHDFTEGCTHYCTRVTHPKWAEGRSPRLVLGAHKFYDDIR